MNQIKLAAIALAVVLPFSSSAFAHDHSKNAVMKDEAMPIHVHNWTGFYAGINAGAVNHTMNITDTQATSFQGTIQQVSNPSFTGGLQAGYRRQWDLTNASGVYGIEGSLNFSNASYSKAYGSPFALYQFKSHNELKTTALLELIGGIAADNTLLFLAAGLSWTSITGNNINQNSIGFFHSFDVNNNAFGTAIGAGIEYAFSDKMSARLKIDVITPNSYSTTANANNTFQIANSIVQGTLGINYKLT